MRSDHRFEDDEEERPLSPAEEKRAFAEHRRSLCKRFGFWRICGNKRCLRVRTCGGEPVGCFSRHWLALPEPRRVWFRALIKMLCHGLSGLAALRAAEEEIARRERVAADLGMADPALMAARPWPDLASMPGEPPGSRRAG
jgi:hypothetical protein